MSDPNEESTTAGAMHDGVSIMPAMPGATTTRVIKAKAVVDLPPEYYAAIGEIAARWNWLEFHLGVLIRDGFELDPKEGRVLTVGMALKVKAHILKIMALKWIDDVNLRTDLRQLASDCQDMLDDRNGYVHAVYGHPVDEPTKIGRIIMGSGEQRYAPDFKETPVAEIRACASKLQALQQRTLELTRRMKERRK